MFDWFASDHHIYHKNILIYCNRPFASLVDQEKALIRNHNSRVKKDDTVLFLGDMWFSRGTQPGYMEQFNGRKFLLRGNHDKGWTTPQLLAFGFVGVFEEHFAGEIDGRLVRFSHYPYAGTSSDKRYLNKRPPVEEDRVLIHGHTHDYKSITTYDTVHVGVDAWNYGPASAEQIIQLVDIIQKRRMQSPTVIDINQVKHDQKKNG